LAQVGAQLHRLRGVGLAVDERRQQWRKAPALVTGLDPGITLEKALPALGQTAVDLRITSQTTDDAIGKPAAVGTAAAPSVELDGRDGAAASSPKQARDVGRAAPGACSSLRPSAAPRRRRPQPGGSSSASGRAWFTHAGTPGALSLPRARSPPRASTCGVTCGGRNGSHAGGLLSIA
jgi:hypothetical protein